MPVIGEVAQKSFSIVRAGLGGFPAFSGTTGQIDHSSGGSTAAGVAVGPGNALRIAAVWIAVTLLADEIASLTRKIVQRDDAQRRVVRPPELRALWDDPNAYQTDFDIAASEVLSLALHGGLFEFLGWTNGGDLGQRFVLDPDACTLERTDNLGLRLKVRGKGELTNTNQPGDRPQFMMVPLYQLPDQLGFVSPVRMAAEILGLSKQYEQAAARLAGEGFNPAAILTAGEFLEDKEADTLARRLEKHAGSRSGRVAVLGGSDLKLEPWTMSMVDAQFVEQSSDVFHTVMALWRVPPTAAGMVDKPSTWGTGIAEFTRGLERFTLRPLTRRLDAAYERYMTRPVDSQLQHKHVFDSLLSADPKDRAEIQLRRIAGGVTSVERVLAQEDEPPFGDDETVYTQLSMGDVRLNELRQQAEVYGALIRAGVEPAAAAAVAGFDPGTLATLGLPPTSLQPAAGA